VDGDADLLLRGFRACGFAVPGAVVDELGAKLELAGAHRALGLGERVDELHVARHHELGHARREELDELCLEQIARYKRPKDYRFAASLPTNNYGKVLKTELRRLAGDVAQ